MLRMISQCIILFLECIILLLEYGECSIMLLDTECFAGVLAQCPALAHLGVTKATN